MRIELGSIPLFPGAGCAGLNKPDSGLSICFEVVAGDGVWSITLECAGGPLAATYTGRGRK